MNFASLDLGHIFVFVDDVGRQRIMRKLSLTIAKEVVGLDRLYTPQYAGHEWALDQATVVQEIDIATLKKFLPRYC